MTDPVPLRRCDWAGSDPLYVRYHDEEWGVPLHDDRALFEFLVLEGAQAGLSWLTILKKRENYRRAFAGFDPHTVAGFGAQDVARLLDDAGIVRNRLKIEAAIDNARAVVQVQESEGSFDRFVWSVIGATPRQNRWQHDGAGARGDPGIGGTQPRLESARLPLRRADDHVCVHAGGRHGQRPPGRLFPPRRVALSGTERARDLISRRRGCAEPCRSCR